MYEGMPALGTVPGLFTRRCHGCLHADNHPSPGILRIQLHALRPGMPDGSYSAASAWKKKRRAIIGTAVIDRNLCLPYAKKLNCLVCEEHCPIPEKAIRFESVTDIDYNGKRVSLKRPYVIEELCNGCGICENKCPLEGRSAIEVFSRRKI